MTGADSFAHYAFFYDGPAQYAGEVLGFLRDGLDAGQPALVAVPPANLDLLRCGLGSDAAGVTFVDMTGLGRNPSRIIPATRRFTDSHRGRPTRFVGEPIWPGRPAPEIREAIRHEALINAAFAGVPTSILCPYDTAGLPARVLDDAWATHPQVLEQCRARESHRYQGTALAAAIGTQPLEPPAEQAEIIMFRAGDLAGLRDWVRQRVSRAGLDTERVADLLIAVNELATNTVVHAGGPGTLRIWRAGGSLLCEVTDTGRINDPLAGRYYRPASAGGGQGLRVVNELCDLVELRSGTWGTTVRLHMDCG
jgi:anti-sigma regulatory factor (Ser/Thr protein kinase)